MHKLSRTSLAALVCPSAPFLAPRLLRTAIPIATGSLQCTPSLGPQRSQYATKAKAKGKEKEKEKDQSNVRKVWTRSPKGMRASASFGLPKEAATLLKQFRAACDSRDAQQLMDLYPSLIEAKLLDRQDTRRIAQALHYCARQASKISDMLPFIQQLLSDIRKGVLEPHPYAFVHLLGIYRDGKLFGEGHKLWQWLVQQDETCVSHAAYGAAIELMAYGGLASLPELEELYTDGLKRFPGTFAEYHLSPDAIVPDRSQSIVIAGVPTVLLQGILTARMLARDWKRAYLALDTILRLYPTQTPVRFFELFMTERPISEAYTAFMLACRAGTTLRPTQVTILLTKMRAAMGTKSSMSDRMMILRAVANALYAYQEAGGQLESVHVAVLVRCCEQLLPEPAPGEDYQGEAAKMRNIIVLAAHGIVSGLIQAGLPIQIHPFEALISMAGKLRVPDLLTTMLQDIEKVHIDLGLIGTRSAVTSAGLLKNQDCIKELWSTITSKADAEGSQIAFEDWIAFTKACRRAELTDYFHEQLSKLSHTTTSSIEQHLTYQIGLAEKSVDTKDFEYMTVEDVTAGIEGLKAQVKNVEAVVMSGTPLSLRQTPFYMHIDPSTTSLSSFENLRAIYDELTTDPHQPPPPSPPEGSPNKPITSSTGIPLDELRFMNWITILEMMDEAEVYESDFQLTFNKIVAMGKPFNAAQAALRFRTVNRNPIFSKDDLRDRIRSLRNPTTLSPAKFRRITSDALVKKVVGLDDKGDTGLLREMKITKHKTQDTDASANLVPPAQVYTKAPTLRYYVGLESNHDAPVKGRRKGDTPAEKKRDISDGPDTY
jgi:hypothetical protein